MLLLDGSTARPLEQCCSTPLLLDPLEQHSKIFSFYVAARRLEGSTGQFCMESWQGKKKKKVSQEKNKLNGYLSFYIFYFFIFLFFIKYTICIFFVKNMCRKRD